MTIIVKSDQELNDVIHHFRPDYPYQNLKHAGPECVYTLNGIHVKIIIQPESEPESK